MVRTVLFVILGVSAGLALATFFQGGSVDTSTPTLPDVIGDSQWRPDGSVPLEQRLIGLETALQEEVAYRIMLQQQVEYLNEELESLQASGQGRRARPEGEDGEALDPEEIRERFAERFEQTRGRNTTERRVGELTEAGFSPDQAERIVQRESELQMQALYAQYEANREGEPFNPFNNRFDASDQLRQELGDADYERYLDATGQSTSIGVRQVLSSSPGEAAGLQAGDDIVAYGGERVFSTSDLNRLTLEGDAGQTVAVDVIRDGQQIQVFVPRGPIGITSGRGGGPPQTGGGMGR